MKVILHITADDRDTLTEIQHMPMKEAKYIGSNYVEYADVRHVFMPVVTNPADIRADFTEIVVSLGASTRIPTGFIYEFKEQLKKISEKGSKR